MKLLRIVALVALCLAYAPAPALAVTGYDSAYSGESAFVTLNPGETAAFQVFFSNTGTVAWTKGSDTEVDLAACLSDKVTCNAQDPSDTPWNNGWISNTRYATHTQAIVSTGSIATFAYNIKAPSSATGTYRFNGDLVLAKTGERIHPQGYYQDATIAAVGNIPLPTPTPSTGGGGGGGGGTPTPPASADLSVTKTSDVEEAVTPGGNIIYTITASNAGPNDAQSVAVVDQVPAGTTFVSFTAPAGWTATTPAAGGTGTITATKASLAASASAVFTLVVKVNANASVESNIANTATVTSTTGDPNSQNNSATNNSTVGDGRADLSITKADSPDPVPAGTDLTYTLTASNAGPSDAHDVGISDTIPASTTFVSFTAPAGWNASAPAAGATGTASAWTETLAAGASATFTLVVHVNANTPVADQISNTATIEGDTFETNWQNNSATELTTVGTGADLSVTKIDLTDPVIAGNTLSYTITAANSGSSDAQNVILIDVIPVGTTFLSFSQTTGPAFTLSAPAPGTTGTASATIASFGAGASATFTLTVKVPANTADGTMINNTSTIGSATADANPANNSDTEATQVITRADLSVTKTDWPDPVIAGTNLTYTLTVNNAGPSDAQLVSLSDTIPANTSFVSLTVPGGWMKQTPVPGETGTVIARTPRLAAGASATLTLVVHVMPNAPDNSTITNTATVASATTDPNQANNAGLATTTVHARADLTVMKTDSPDPINTGSNLTYSLTLTNVGPSDAQMISLGDTLPANTTFVSFTQNTGPAFTLTTPAVGGTGIATATTATLAASGVATFTLVVNVMAPQSTLTNTATATSITADPNPTNNSGSADTQVVNPLLCFAGGDGVCTLTPGGANLNNGAGPYSGVYYLVSRFTGKTLAEVTDLSFNYEGSPVGGGTPRITVPIDDSKDGTADGVTDSYAFISAEHCTTEGLVSLSTCRIFYGSDDAQFPGYDNWAAFATAHPDWTVAVSGDGDPTVPYVVADTTSTWNVSNVNLGQ